MVGFKFPSSIRVPSPSQAPTTRAGPGEPGLVTARPPRRRSESLLRGRRSGVRRASVTRSPGPGSLAGPIPAPGARPASVARAAVRLTRPPRARSRLLTEEGPARPADAARAHAVRRRGSSLPRETRKSSAPSRPHPKPMRRARGRRAEVRRLFPSLPVPSLCLEHFAARPPRAAPLHTAPAMAQPGPARGSGPRPAAAPRARAARPAGRAAALPGAKEEKRCGGSRRPRGAVGRGPGRGCGRAVPPWFARWTRTR